MNEKKPSRNKWGEIALAVALAFIVSYGQRKMGSATFETDLQRLNMKIRRVFDQPHDPIIPNEFLRDLYDGTR